MSNISYNNVRVFEDNGTVCFLGNNPLINSTPTAAEHLHHGILTLDTIDENDSMAQIPIHTRKLKLGFENEFRKGLFKPFITAPELFGEIETASDFSQTSFDWIRGVSLSGWLTKISQNPSRISKLVKRFLVLDNYVLRCYKTEPTDDISRGHSKDFSETALTADTAISVDPGRSMTILTPTKKIIIKIQDEQDRIVRWYQELRRAVQQLNARIAKQSENRLEFVWVHPAPVAAIVAADQWQEKRTFVTVSLLRTPSDEGQPVDAVQEPPGSVSGRSKDVSYSVKSKSAAPSAFNYFLLIGTNTSAAKKLEILNLSESKSFNISLECVKIFGGNIIFGGSGGFVGVGVLGKATGIRGNWAAAHRKVLYCVSLESLCNKSGRSGSQSQSTDKSSSNNNNNNNGRLKQGSHATTTAAASSSWDIFGGAYSSYPHWTSTKIVCIATSNSSDMFAVMDSDEIISFWNLARTDGEITNGTELSAYWAAAGNSDVRLTNISKCYKVKPQLMYTMDLSAEMAFTTKNISFSVEDLDVTSSPKQPLSADRHPKMQFSADDAFLQVICNGQQVLLSLRSSASEVDGETSPTNTSHSSHEGFFNSRMKDWMEEKSAFTDED